MRSSTNEAVEAAADARVRANLALAPRPTNRRDELAARLLFSVLADLEQIAVTAAERGGGVPGQLEDELVHRETFARIARQLGGRLPTPESIEALTAFLRDLRGSASLAILNVVAESWLEGVFREVASWPLAPRLFSLIADEELRHSREALAAARLDPEDAAPLVREAERLIWSVAADPLFHVPLCWLGGVQAVARMGRANAENHRAACVALGATASSYALEIGRCGEELEEVGEPRPVGQTEWQRSALELDLPPIHNLIDVRYRRLTEELEARVVRAVSEALAEHPRLNRTISVARGELYEPAGPAMLVRRLHDRDSLVMSVPVASAHLLPAAVLRRLLSRRAARMRALPYRGCGPVRLLEPILPPPRAAATVTNVAGTGVERGLASLSRAEGATIAVAVGDVRRGWLSRRRYVTIGVTVDHRVHNGYELGLVSRAIKEKLNDG